MGMTLKELLTKGEGTLSAQEAKALAAQCRMDLDTLYTLLEERGIKIQEEETEPGLDVEGIMAEVENAENNNDDLGIGADEDEDQGEENPADLKAAMQGVLFRLAGVVGRRHDLPVAGHHSPHRHFAQCGRLARLVQRGTHQFKIGHAFSFYPAANTSRLFTVCSTQPGHTRPVRCRMVPSSTPSTSA